MENVLYCGMADDILTPLLLIPTLDNLFVIDYFDAAFAKNANWDGQKNDIKECLACGSDIDSHHLNVMRYYDNRANSTKLNSLCTIISETDKNNCWELKFNYNNRSIQLFYFHHIDFLNHWNENIQDINHLITIGAYFPFENTNIQKMIKERCSNKCQYYDCATNSNKKTYKNIRNTSIFKTNLKSLNLKIINSKNN